MAAVTASYMAAVVSFILSYVVHHVLNCFPQVVLIQLCDRLCYTREIIHIRSSKQTRSTLNDASLMQLSLVQLDFIVFICFDGLHVIHKHGAWCYKMHLSPCAAECS